MEQEDSTWDQSEFDEEMVESTVVKTVRKLKKRRFHRKCFNFFF